MIFLNVDKDGIWKDAVEQYLPLLLKRMMPELYKDVNFSQGFSHILSILKTALIKRIRYFRSADMKVSQLM